MTIPDSNPKQQTLDGSWWIAQDTDDQGKSECWYKPSNYPTQTASPIQVPGNIWEAFPNYNGVSWYSLTFKTNLTVAADMNYYLRFGAVQYLSEIWVNGQSLGTHEGADTPFELDVTDVLVQGKNFIAVRVENPLGIFKNGTVPVFYDMGGIVQHVMLVKQSKLRIKDVFATADISTGVISLQIELENNSAAAVTASLIITYGEFRGENIGAVTSGVEAPIGTSQQNITVTISSPHLWSLEDPYLYEIKVTADAGGQQDEFHIPRFGFKDFRITDGYFYLNHKRIFIKSAHQNFYDPIYTQGTPRDMTYLGQDLAIMKAAGFNMYRTIVAGALPEQLELADELGMLIYEEHQGSWLLKDASKFSLAITDIIKRDRNHPSVAIWGLLNENPKNATYTAAKEYLPTLRSLDNSRLVLLSSGRWDGELTTASASNPGSSTWNVYLGGEAASNPSLTGELADMWPIDPNPIGGFVNGAGDIHVYQNFPNTWDFITSFAKLGSETQSIFVTEGGAGSLFNAIGEKKKLERANVPLDANPWSWTTPKVDGLTNAWVKYELTELYPDIEDMLKDSQRSQSKARAAYFNVIRSNPKIMGYSLTSLTDAFGLGEGILDNFRAWKADSQAVIEAGWAKLKWNLFVNPMSVYTDSIFHVKASLANEDYLAAGTYPAKLSIENSAGATVWSAAVSTEIQSGTNPPLAYTLYEQDISIAGLTEGLYTLSATLTTVPNAKANTLNFNVYSTVNHYGRIGQITVLGVTEAVRDLLTSHGAALHEYNANETIINEAILVGNNMTGHAETWRALYKKAARGAHIIFLSKGVFRHDAEVNKWIAVARKGDQSGPYNGGGWLYHQENIAKNHPIMKGLPTKVLTPDMYGGLLANPVYLKNITTPDDTTAVGFNCNEGPYADGVMIGTYNTHAGKFTINTFDLIGNLGNPLADRLLLNLAAFAKANAAIAEALPANYDSELDEYGIVD